ncbi:MAG: redox-active disulfide protein 2 [Acidobacteria bacterium RIFCSPLOWO2_02_FULL_67_36]|nr:MAG: redox-active disulfide protein 2 [Acidobacteria bacterium RIFCSPLOWO2_02_FULL_67_36]OFW26386.1 MAG: redox-active disulfide protein 2 [Acidobacteria bacterium RIFCSPLOWO2_12_FULL_66_21]
MEVPVKKLQILGSGCPKCRMLTDHAEQAAKALGLEYTIEKVTNIDDIIAFGIMATPALVVDGEVKVSGRVPTAEAIKALLV